MPNIAYRKKDENRVSTTDRFEMVMPKGDKDLLQNAAALVGTTMANFVRMAARDRAREVVEQESRVLMSARDFNRFATALSGSFQPNAALKRAMKRAEKVTSV